MPPELVLNLLSKKWIYAQVPPINGTRKGTILHHRLSWSMITKMPTQAQMTNKNKITIISHIGNFFFAGAIAIRTGPAGTWPE